MQIEALSALVYTSPAPARLAEFYTRELGIAFKPESHGPMRHHLEAWHAGIHFAILKGAAPAEASGPSPTFRVRELDRFIEALTSAGAPPIRKPIDLGEGKRVASFRDPDGNTFNLIELHSPGAA